MAEIANKPVDQSTAFTISAAVRSLRARKLLIGFASREQSTPYSWWCRLKTGGIKAGREQWLSWSGMIESYPRTELPMYGARSSIPRRLE